MVNWKNLRRWDWPVSSMSFIWDDDNVDNQLYFCQYSVVWCEARFVMICHAAIFVCLSLTMLVSGYYAKTLCFKVYQNNIPKCKVEDCSKWIPQYFDIYVNTYTLEKNYFIADSMHIVTITWRFRLKTYKHNNKNMNQINRNQQHRCSCKTI
jgi:hypothetical protein